MSTPTVQKLPTIRGCGQTATDRIEAYSARDGRMHGSLDGTVYTCGEHAAPVADQYTAAGFTPYSMAVADLQQIEVGAEPRRCGLGFDFTGDKTRIYEAPEPKPVPSAPIAGQLAAALRAGATDPQQSAALDILLGLPYQLYARQNLRDRYIVSTPAEATVLWELLHDDLRTDQVPVSPGERRMLLIACSIAVPSNPVSLNEVLAGLDSPNALLILSAVERLVRGHR